MGCQPALAFGEVSSVWLVRLLSEAGLTQRLPSVKRALGPFAAKQKRHPARGGVLCSGAGEKSRTPDLRITNALLYQLSYTGALRQSCRCKESEILADGRQLS